MLQNLGQRSYQKIIIPTKVLMSFPFEKLPSFHLVNLLSCEAHEWPSYPFTKLPSFLVAILSCKKFL